ncbi:MAG: PEP-CTERM sorting domain-containing protein, partial [Opitutales bacterium]
AWGSDDAHQRDFIFHVTKDTSTGSLLVGASNNTSFEPREDLESINHVSVASSGWYNFQHVFREEAGVLAVDLQLLDSGGGLLFSETRSNVNDLIPSEVGGNGYAWFTNIDVTGGIAIDSTQLSVVPEPSVVLGMLTSGVLGLLIVRRRR